MDVHVPAGITRALLRRGVDVLTAQSDDASLFSDNELLGRATTLERILFTRDEDLLIEATFRQREQKAFAGIVYAHQLRVTIGQCVNDLELIARVYEPADMLNRVEHLPLK